MRALKRIVITLVLPLIAFGSFLLAGERGPSTPDERAHFVSSVRGLEANPLQEGAAGLRTALLKWLTEVPDVSAKVCADLLAKVRKSDYAYAPELTLHEAFGAGIFAIEHPDQAKDDVAIYTAGLEAALRVYEAILKSKPDARDTFLTDLVSKRDKGELGAYVKKASQKCE